MDSRGAQYLPGGGEGNVPQWWGMYFGYIAVNQDPLAQGRVKLRIPQVFGNTTSGWASPMIPLAYVPKVGTPVTCMFVGGDPAQPVWFGNFAIPEGASGMVFSATQPSNPELGEIWVNTSAGQNQGQMSEWNGAGWVAYQIGGAAILTGADLSAPNITGGVITGAQFVAVGASGEILVYSGTPALGNLVASFSASAGTDSVGNAYLAGNVSYELVGPNMGAVQQTGLAVTAYTATSAAGPWTQVQSLFFVVNPSLGFYRLALGGTAGATIEVDSPFETMLHVVQPGTTATAESWHAATLQNSWAGSGSATNGLFYRLTAFNEVRIIGDLNSPGTASVIATLPTGYRPATGINIAFGRYDDSGQAHALVGADGTITMQTVVGAGKGMFVNALVPLGTL